MIYDNHVTYEKKLSNSEWDEMEITIENNRIEISCDLGRVTLSHEDFDNLVSCVKDFREMGKITNINIE